MSSDYQSIPANNNPRPSRGRGGGRSRGAANDNSAVRRPPPKTGRAAGEEQQLIIKQVDMSELNTEEDMQREKLEAAIEIREGVKDLKECYDQFGELVTAQGVKLQEVKKNVETTEEKMQKGTEQLKGAQVEQKKSRKMMCCVVVILVVVIAIVVVVVVVLKK